MRPAVCLAAVLVLAAGCGGTKSVTRTVTVDSSAKHGVGAPLEHVEFGYIKSLEQKGADYELKFDPAWFLSGETANKAAAEDGAVPPGEPVPNDNYVVDESPRTLTYLVRPGAHVTVLVNNDTGILSTPITMSELAEIVRTGKSSQHELFEPLESGVWIRTRIDTVCALDQQYRP
jgi:hypothetical protein